MTLAPNALHQESPGGGSAGRRGRLVAGLVWTSVILFICLRPSGDESAAELGLCLICGDKGLASLLLNIVLYMPLGFALRLASGSWTPPPSGGSFPLPGGGDLPALDPRPSLQHCGSGGEHFRNRNRDRAGGDPGLLAPSPWLQRPSLRPDGPGCGFGGGSRHRLSGYSHGSQRRNALRSVGS